MSSKVWMVCLVSAVMLSGCRTWTPERYSKQWQDVSTGSRPDIQLRVNLAETRVDIKDPLENTCKAKGRRAGCVSVKKNGVGAVTFKLMNPDASTYHIAKFVVCIKTDPDEQDLGTIKNELDCSLDVWERLEFVALVGGELILPNASGIIDLSNLDPDQVTIWSPNAVKQVYFYGIEVCEDLNPSTCFDTDPEWENEGRGFL